MGDFDLAPRTLRPRVNCPSCVFLAEVDSDCEQCGGWGDVCEDCLKDECGCADE